MRRMLRLSLEGFKTFARRTELELGPGMTAVVGPNGSGKSNLIDAIAWAVGSRSWKSLRGDGMEDVIFHGADREPAAPAATVTLSFDNDDRLLGVDFAEVTISREISRGGGSRVLVNGVEARIRDVQAFLSGTGLVGGFSLLRQGMVDRLVLSPPEEIGRWVEESANIAGYRSRKQQALDRLRKVEAHAVEAERKAASLRRELNQVRERALRARARRLFEERRASLRKILTALDRRRLAEALETVDAESARIRSELKSLAESRREWSDALHGDEAPARLPVVDADIAERAARIRAAGNSLASIADGLTRDGARGWPDADALLGRTSAEIQEIRRPGAAPSARLADLRRSAAELERLDREGAALTAELSGRACERARLEERLAALGPEDDAPIPAAVDPGRAREELEAVSQELAAAGPVDETAEEREQQILREQSELMPILQDLAATRAQLAAFLRQMERYTSQVFARTLAQVESRFRSYCGILFQGGEARLEKAGPRESDSADPRPPEVEVRVKLPRKPETSLALLSGGERSLAGLALVLALAAGEGRESGRLLILDEVDAALDEANAARFALLLRELQRDHQILCVTHNRLTMHQAARLVGVTSGSTSASTLVNVALERIDPAA